MIMPENDAQVDRASDNAVIEDFLSRFDGDAEAAISAVRDYSAAQKIARNKIINPPHDSSEIILSAHNISKSYKLGSTKLEVLKNITLDIYKAEIVVLTGASGSGKSTLLHILGCVDHPTTGEVILEGKNITKLHDRALSAVRKSKIGFVFQSFYLQPFLKLGDNVAVPAMFTRTKKPAIDTNVAELLGRVGLSDREAHFPRELSGGQIQRAAIARALINNPSIIIADEPTGNLDSQNGQTVIDLFKSIRDKSGTTIIIASHDQTIASQADRVITLKDGAIV